MNYPFELKVKELAEFANDEGVVQHMVRATDREHFLPVQEVYFSFVNPGVTKGWHCHSEQTSMLSCISGVVELAIFGPAGTTSESVGIRLGDGERKLVIIPPRLTYGWRNLSEQPSILANCSTHVHDPSKSTKTPLDQLAFDWTS